MSENCLNLVGSFEERLQQLSEGDRLTFEQSARVIEDRGAAGERDCAALVASLELLIVVRSLLLVHAGKVWLDVTQGDVGAILDTFPELQSEGWAIDELQSWKSQWGAVQRPTPLDSQHSPPQSDRQNPAL